MELRPKHHALLFSCIAKAAIDRLGERGKEAVVRGVVAYGEQRGRRMARRAEADGVKIDAKAYLLYGEWYDKYKESDFSCTTYQHVDKSFNILLLFTCFHFILLSTIIYTPHLLANNKTRGLTTLLPALGASCLFCCVT